jgi:tight adherence protein B
MPLDSNGLMLAGPLPLAALSITAIVFLLINPYLSGEHRTDKRIQGGHGKIGQSESRSRRRRRSPAIAGAMVADTLKELEDRQKAREKVSLRLRLQRAGLDVQPWVFWLASLVCGVSARRRNLADRTQPADCGAAVGLVRWHLGVAALDSCAHDQTAPIQVHRRAGQCHRRRGVKSGLPLNEIIARESPQPVAGEFTDLVEQQRVGVPLGECFERMMARLPLPEAGFFAIVIAIQQQAGGNLSEALGNLSGVLRDRKRLSAKVRALSAEASAAVLGALPFIVMILDYITTPSSVSILWTRQFGQFPLVCAGCWMMCGILVMRKMINFKY